MIDRTGRSRWLLLIALISLALPGGCEKPPPDKADEKAPPPPVAREIKHVILIVSDALRRDALACYNDKITGTENIDALAADGLRFARAISAAPWTLPAMATIFTGTDPSVHQAGNLNSVLPAQFHTLAEYMRHAGYVTGAIVHNPSLVRTGLDQGFTTYEAWPDQNRYGTDDTPSTQELTDKMLAWFDEHKDQKVFFWLHYLDPHSPYYPPEPYRRPPQITDDAWQDFPKENQGKFPWIYRQPGKTQLVNHYVGEVQYVDDQTGRIIDHLKELGLYDDALIIFTADHGEEFFEHGRYGHSDGIYSTLLRVPLIIKLPGQKTAGKVIDQICGTVSIAPTVLDLCGIEHALEGFSTKSLRTLWQNDNQDVPDRAVFSNRGISRDHHRHTVTWSDHKYLRWAGAADKDYVVIDDEKLPVEDLYDIKADPYEMKSIIAEMPQIVAQGRILMDQFEKDAERLRQYHQSQQPQERQLDDETIKNLKALGYVQ